MWVEGNYGHRVRLSQHPECLHSQSCATPRCLSNQPHIPAHTTHHFTASRIASDKGGGEGVMGEGVIEEEV